MQHIDNETEKILPDYFNREPIARKMCELIVNAETVDISPIVLDGPWGSGKTVHAGRLKEILENEYQDTVKCVYWNAAEVDFAQNPLPMFVAALYQHVPKETKSSYVKKGLALCGGALKGATLSLFNQLCENTIKVNPGELYQSAKEGAHQAELNTDAERQFEAFLIEAGDEQSRVVAAIELLEIVREEKQLIVIIDELDRCRPDFALKMLECIKHLFSISSCKFLLVMNKTSMVSSVQHLYGLDEKSAGVYLHKYIKTNFQLPHVLIEQWKTDICAVTYFFRYLRERNSDILIDECMQDFIATIFENKDFNLREMEKLADSVLRVRQISNFAITPNSSRLFVLLEFFVAYLVYFEPENALRLVAKQCSLIEILEPMGLARGTVIHGVKSVNEAGKWLVAVLACYLTSSSTRDEVLERYASDLDKNAILMAEQAFSRLISYCTFVRIDI